MHTKRRYTYVGLVAVLALALVAAGLSAPAPAAGAASYDFSLLELCLNLIRNYYPGEYSIDRLMEGAAKGLVQALGDPYSDYLTASEYQSLMTGLAGAFGGLGIYIDTSPDGYVVIIAPIKGTPADLAGLRPGDKIATVDGEDFRYTEINAASRRLRGEPGTKVTLGIIRLGVSGLLQFELTRAWIEVDPVESEMLDSDTGYIHLSTFSETATARIDQAIAELRAAGAKGVVLDLRNNGGGLLNQAIFIADRFLTTGQVVLSVHTKTGEPDVYRATGNRYLGLPVVVLVNEGTASASEILAGAIGDNGMGTIVGTTTYGKGAIQNVWGITTGGGLKLTTAQYLLPSGVALQGRGITPDEVVAEDLDQVAPQLAWYRVIRHMRVGLDVLELQEALIFLGYGGSPADGVYGMRWVEAVKGFQRDHGLYQTGEVNEKTASALNRAAAEHLAATAADAQLERAVEILRAKY